MTKIFETERARNLTTLHVAWGGQLVQHELDSKKVFEERGPVALRTFRRLGIAAVALRALQKPFTSPDSFSRLPAYGHGTLPFMRREINQMRPRWPRYHNQIEDANPPNHLRAFKGDDLTWPEWLNLPKIAGGPNRDQLTQLAAWNVTVMFDEQRESAEQFKLLSEQYQQGVERAEQSGLVSPVFLQRVQQTAPHTQWFITGPLQPMTFDGRAYPERNAILLHPQCSMSTISHENTHLMGGFDDVLFDEVATDILTEQIFGGATGSCYEPAKLAVQQVLDGADINPYELSEIYAAGDTRQNTKALKKRLGGNVYRDLERYYKRRCKFYTRRSEGNERYWAGVDLVCHLNPGLGYPEILGALNPHMPPEDVQKRASWLETLRKTSYGHFLMANFEVLKMEFEQNGPKAAAARNKLLGEADQPPEE